MLSPVRGNWYFGNGMTQIGFSPHAHFHERYSYDLTQHDANGATFDGPDDDNDSFFCYSEEIHAMADGVVLGCNSLAPENHGHVTDSGDASNYVILGHDGGLVYRAAHATNIFSRKARTTPAIRGSRSRSVTRFRLAMSSAISGTAVIRAGRTCTSISGASTQWSPASVAHALQRPPRRRLETRAVGHTDDRRLRNDLKPCGFRTLHDTLPAPEKQCLPCGLRAQRGRTDLRAPRRPCASRTADVLGLRAAHPDACS